MAQYRVAAGFTVGKNATLTGPVLQVDGFGDLQGIEIHGEGVHELLTGEPIARLREIAVKVATCLRAKGILDHRLTSVPNASVPSPLRRGEAR
jgi:hypothetical protein